LKIDKYIAQNGFTSRRKAFDLITEKKVFVNNKIANFSTQVNKGDVVVIAGKKLIEKEFVPVYIAYNKPKGIICTTEKIAGNIIDAVQHPATIYPVGRLDKDSEGLILLTNHGAIIDKIANAEFGHEKEYIVTLNLPVRKKFLEEISAGIELDCGGGKTEKTKPCKVSLEPNAKRIFRITLTQGLNRQIRRMCNARDYQVIKLQRVRIMHIKLDTLKLDEWRNLSDEEISQLFSLISYKNTHSL
jgi:23S rRNA pseudouridine2604 synthase